MKQKSKNSNSKFKIFNSILLYYSTILSTILIIGGFWTAKSKKEIISNIIFLPVIIFLWIVLVKHRKKRKSANPIRYNKSSSRANKIKKDER